MGGHATTKKCWNGWEGSTISCRLLVLRTFFGAHDPYNTRFLYITIAQMKWKRTSVGSHLHFELRLFLFREHLLTGWVWWLLSAFLRLWVSPLHLLDDREVLLAASILLNTKRLLHVGILYVLAISTLRSPWDSAHPEFIQKKETAKDMTVEWTFSMLEFSTFKLHQGRKNVTGCPCRKA